MNGLFDKRKTVPDRDPEEWLLAAERKGLRPRHLTELSRMAAAQAAKVERLRRVAEEPPELREAGDRRAALAKAERIGENLAATLREIESRRPGR